MKKEYLILTALILIFSAYLLLHKENKDNYTLPEIEKIDISKVTGLLLDKKQGQIKFTKKEKNWRVTDNAYPGDLTAVENMLDALKTLRLSALVSQNEDLNRYDLDKDNRIQVTVMEGEKTVFKFTMGKTAPTSNHTFVMLANDKNIYHAGGSFRSSFDKTVEEFRDKKVVEFKEASIKKFTIEKDGISKTFSSKTEKKDKDKVLVTWHAEDGTPADKETVSNLLSALSFLECEKYLTASGKKELENKKPLCTIRLENKDAIAVTIFPTEVKDTVTGISSMNPYAFSLSQYTGKEIVSDIETLLGIKGPEEQKE